MGSVPSMCLIFIVSAILQVFYIISHPQEDILCLADRAELSLSSPALWVESDQLSINYTLATVTFFLIYPAVVFFPSVEKDNQEANFAVSLK